MVPAALNVIEKVWPVLSRPESKLPSSAVTGWGTPLWLLVQLMVLPAVTVTVAGVKAKLLMLTVALSAAAGRLPAAAPATSSATPAAATSHRRLSRVNTGSPPDCSGCVARGAGHAGSRW